MNAKKNDSNNLAIIGASGTGKTVLAVGLYATAKKEAEKGTNLSVSPVGDETRKYIEIRQTNIEEGVWPAATNEAENLDLRLRLHAGGKETDIVFREYMGERMEQPNYIQDVIGTPKAAMILFNPGMPGLKSAEKRNQMIGNLKVIAQRLKDGKCAAVAFVVTASDRLSSDLEGFRDEFEHYASMVTTHLDALGLKWKRFDVTITGRLEDQDHPKLALGEDNTTLDPFLWLLECINKEKTKGLVKRIAAWTAGIAAVLLLAAAVQSGRSGSALRKVESEKNLVTAQLENARRTRNLAAAVKGVDRLRDLRTNDLVRAPVFGHSTAMTGLKEELRDLDDLWSVRLLSMEFDDTAAKIARDPLLLPLGWAKAFDDRVKTAKPEEPNAVSEMAALRTKWNDKRTPLERTWQIAALQRQVDLKVRQLEIVAGDKIPAQLKDGFDFLKSIPRDYPLVENRDELSARLNAARTNALARYCASITTWDVEDETPPAAGPELKQKLKTDLAGKISEPEFAATEKALLEHQKSARAEWDAYQLPKRTREHENALKTAGANPLPALKSSLRFLESMETAFPTIAKGTALEKRHAIERARKEALKAYADSLASKWDVNDRKPPEFDGEKLRATIDGAVSPEEAADFALDLNKRFQTASQQWNARQKQLVDQFRTDGDIQTVVRNYGEFIDDNPNNPHLDSLHERMYDRVFDFFADYMKDYYAEFFGSNRIGNETYPQSRMERAQRRFNEFRAVCLAIAGNGWGASPIQKEAMGKFARLCVNRGNLQNAGLGSAFEQTIRVTKVEVRFQPDSLDSSFNGMYFDCRLLADRFNFSSMQTDRIANSLLFEDVFLPRSSNRQWVTLWSGSQTLRANPWTFTSFRIWFREKLGEGLIEAQHDSAGFWLDFNAGPQTDDFSTTVYFEHMALWNTDVKGQLSIRFSFVGEGPELISLWKEATE